MRGLMIILVVLGLSVAALGIHIYVVTRPRVDGHSRGMVRIDLHQRLDQGDADRIAGWLRRQRGVDHVLVNRGTAIAVFTYLPGAANPGLIMRSFRDSLPYSRAERYLPGALEVSKGCPMRAAPVTNSIYEFFKHIF
jgi:hypothetical protein